MKTGNAVQVESEEGEFNTVDDKVFRIPALK